MFSGFASKVTKFTTAVSAFAFRTFPKWPKDCLFLLYDIQWNSVQRWGVTCHPEQKYLFQNKRTSKIRFCFFFFCIFSLLTPKTTQSLKISLPVIWTKEKHFNGWDWWRSPLQVASVRCRYNWKPSEHCVLSSCEEDPRIQTGSGGHCQSQRWNQEMVGSLGKTSWRWKGFHLRRKVSETRLLISSPTFHKILYFFLLLFGGCDLSEDPHMHDMCCSDSTTLCLFIWLSHTFFWSFVSSFATFKSLKGFLVLQVNEGTLISSLLFCAFSTFVLASLPQMPPRQPSWDQSQTPLEICHPPLMFHPPNWHATTPLMCHPAPPPCCMAIVPAKSLGHWGQISSSLCCFSCSMTAVDCVVGYTTMYASVVANCSLLTADDFPNAASYLSRLKKRPGFSNNVGQVSEWP